MRRKGSQQLFAVGHLEIGKIKPWRYGAARQYERAGFLHARTKPATGRHHHLKRFAPRWMSTQPVHL